MEICTPHVCCAVWEFPLRQAPYELHSSTTTPAKRSISLCLSWAASPGNRQTLRKGGHCARVGQAFDGTLVTVKRGHPAGHTEAGRTTAPPEFPTAHDDRHRVSY